MLGILLLLLQIRIQVFLFLMDLLSLIVGNIVIVVTDQNSGLFSVSAGTLTAGNVATVQLQIRSAVSFFVSAGSLIAGNVVTVATDQKSSFQFLLDLLLLGM